VSKRWKDAFTGHSLVSVLLGVFVYTEPS